MRFSSASLVTAEPNAIYGAIITADRLLYHPANILGTNPIAAQPLHTSSRHSDSQVQRLGAVSSSAQGRDEGTRLLLAPIAPLLSPNPFSLGKK